MGIFRGGRRRRICWAAAHSFAQRKEEKRRGGKKIKIATRSAPDTGRQNRPRRPSGSPHRAETRTAGRSGDEIISAILCAGSVRWLRREISAIYSRRICGRPCRGCWHGGRDAERRRRRKEGRKERSKWSCHSFSFLCLEGKKEEDSMDASLGSKVW